MAYLIYFNAYFSEWYFFGYMICLLPEFIAFTLFGMYLCSQDSEYSRNKLPTIMLLMWITALLLISLVLIYILAIYPYDDVYVGWGDKAADGEEETHYSK